MKPNDKRYSFVYVPHLDFHHLKNSLMPNALMPHDYLIQQGIDNFMIGMSIFLSVEDHKKLSELAKKTGEDSKKVHK